MRGERACPVRVLAREVDLAGTQPGIQQCRLLQFLHQMLAFHQEAAQLLAELLVVELLDVLEFHDRLRATASATLIPSTPADRMPPAYPAPSPHGYRPRTFRLCS